MARKRRKSSHKRRRSRKQLAAARRNIKKALAALRRRKKGGKKRRKARHGRKHRRRGGKKSRRRSHGAAVGGSTAYQKVYNRIIAKGGSAAHAHKVASRLERMRKGRISRFFTKQSATQESENRLANLFSGLASAGRAHKALG